MARAVPEIEREIEQLSAADRSRLLKFLIEQVDAPADSDVDAAWIAESERRLDEIEAGTVQTYSGRSVMQEARARGK